VVNKLLSETCSYDELKELLSFRKNKIWHDFYLNSYKKLQKSKLPQRQLSKEFVRQWLIENGFQGKQGQIVPPMSSDYIKVVSERYIELYEKITGSKFIKSDTSDIQLRIKSNVDNYFESK
jgi:phosphoribosylaminoimidazole-succinocarboxamide synthase